MSQRVEDLTALYMSQSPTAFTAFAMSAEDKPNDHSGRVDTEEHGGDSKCDYSCCSESGYCNSWGWHIGLAACVVCCCACCCYVTDGFGGVWTYWPF
jgi:hypothetical protein